MGRRGSPLAATIAMLALAFEVAYCLVAPVQVGSAASTDHATSFLSFFHLGQQEALAVVDRPELGSLLGLFAGI